MPALADDAAAVRLNPTHELRLRPAPEAAAYVDDRDITSCEYTAMIGAQEDRFDGRADSDEPGL